MHDLIALEWTHELEAKSFIGFSDRSGKEYLRISSNTINPYQHEGWLFHPFNPWQKRFDRFTRIFLEHGLIREFKKQAMKEMKSEAKVEFLPPKDVNYINHAMKMSEFGGIFAIFILALLIAILGFAFESTGKLRIVFWKRNVSDVMSIRLKPKPYKQRYRGLSEGSNFSSETSTTIDLHQVELNTYSQNDYANDVSYDQVF